MPCSYKHCLADGVGGVHSCVVGLTMILVLAIFAAALGMFQFGYNTSVINQPQKYIEAFINESYEARGIDYPTTESEITTLFRSAAYVLQKCMILCYKLTHKSAFVASYYLRQRLEGFRFQKDISL